MNTHYILNILKAHSCRITPQRHTILNVLIEHNSRLLSPEQITQYCQLTPKQLSSTTQKNPDINMTTVYRNLELLLKYEVVISQQIDKSTTGYKLKCHDRHHHHLTCITCGKMIPFDYCPMDSELTNLASINDFTIVDHRLELTGYCSQCCKNQ